MLTVWAPGTDGRPDRLADGLAGLAPGQLPLWIDLYQPDAAEEQAVEALLGIDVPTATDRGAMEDSAQFYSDHDTLFLTCAVMGRRSDGPFSSEPVTFILTRSTLVTVRTNNPRAFEVGTGRASAQVSDARTPHDVLLALLEGIIERLADLMQECSADMGRLSGRVFKADVRLPGAREEKASLKTIGRIGGLLAIALHSLSGLGRLMAYCEQSKLCETMNQARMTAISRDITLLGSLSEALQSKCSFLLDALLGMAAAGQNASLRALSIATILFVPPTLISSIFGMNFEAMSWFQTEWGLYAAFGLMIAAPATLFSVARWLRWF